MRNRAELLIQRLIVRMVRARVARPVMANIVLLGRAERRQQAFPVKPLDGDLRTPAVMLRVGREAFLTDHLLPFTNTHPLANQLPYCLSFPPCWFHPCYSLFLQHCLLCCHGCCGFTLLCVHLTNPVSSLPTGLSQSFPKRNVLFPSCETIFPDRYLRQSLRHRETRKGLKLLE